MDTNKIVDEEVKQLAKHLQGTAIDRIVILSKMIAILSVELVETTKCIQDN